ncbi:hypothetical protein EMIHUDRAFT_116959 [Emiliania huxleyi CCMP1516]|uniref:Serine/threonine-protein phosphatase 2A activator n=2 Tax=Emiliania huxleyi TaxID=2903 RepID=A0A0D3JEI1_EMIH1|nr:hypothetical protein EMIHUDRAFT_116959 [Emiliania huxleyi CCMP1516]EOD21916.1 hypothetical protein EMIHUDRAFT_116959 [Emiliania huxleyi CCMP1516]|mmetsp:Transcript_480/g.1489  ORF Transcript_480/g.1489 Transcript_480/m.1489 type:complete len:333 (+) Transcript_480:31-1029(+)|eukprot:XP_005774345.1 hypothetical protein EMIHUDRAFT_116959 [Emiliania huxleyi CCMP1516]
MDAAPGLLLAEARRAAAAAENEGVLTKRICDQRTLQHWKLSASHAALMQFANDLAEAVVGRAVSDTCEERPVIGALLAEFDAMAAWIDEIPPIQQAMRYGNKAFKAWHARMAERAPALMAELLEQRAAPESGAPAAPADAAAELAAYFAEAFGSPTRIDYGTGHELQLLAWLRGLELMQVLDPADRPAVVLRVFERYLALMRRLQTTYCLEPAGSHGVWGLDDYQHLVFVFGAAQLVGHARIQPSSIHDEELLAEAGADYLYLAAVAFIRKVKKGPFGEHSPYLNDISAIDSWDKVVKGLLRMYEGEVLGKLPVVQHLRFGALLPWATPYND